VTAVLALVSSLLWGTADFLGGTVSRRVHPLAVVAGAYLPVVAVLIPVAAAAGELDAPLGYLPWGLSCGVVGLAALSMFYAALATGTMGVVAPLAALGVVVPVGVGIASGDRLGTLQLSGIVVAAAGVVWASGPDLRGPGGLLHPQARPVLLALGAGLGFGYTLVALDGGAETSAVMTLVSARLTSLVVSVSIGWLGQTWGGFTPRDLPAVALVGATDTLANAAYALASRDGLASVTAVLGSLYPAVTVVLARIVHGERMSAGQGAGVLVILTGVALIAAGGGTG
jgi:drug/metabolite transporter (DMT)-like permease